MSYVHPCNHGNLEDVTRESSGALFRSDSFFVVWAIHVVITSVRTVSLQRESCERQGKCTRERQETQSELLTSSLSLKPVLGELFLVNVADCTAHLRRKYSALSLQLSELNQWRPLSLTQPISSATLTHLHVCCHMHWPSLPMLTIASTSDGSIQRHGCQWESGRSPVCMHY